jgi:hypothetical protein
MGETSESIVQKRDTEVSNFLHKALMYPSLDPSQQDIVVHNMMTMSYENKIIALACLKKFILDHPNEPQAIIQKISELLERSDNGVTLFTKELADLMSRSSLDRPGSMSAV